jgi:hypothetical protein
MIFEENYLNPEVSTDNGQGAFVARRVTIGAYSDRPEFLIFTPDVMLIRPEGRYILPPNQRFANQEQLPILDLMSALLHGSDNDNPDITIRKTLEKAWYKLDTPLRSESAGQSWVLIP